MLVKSNWLEERFSTDRHRLFCDRGSRVVTTFSPVFDQRGIWHLEETGKENRYLDIQSHADSCDINVIMARYRNGETDVLSRVQGFFGDVTELPTNYIDVMNAKIKAEKLFNGLSPEVKEKYGNSVDMFMAALGTKEGLEAIGFKFEDKPNDPIEPIKKEGVTEDA